MGYAKGTFRDVAAGLGHQPPYLEAEDKPTSLTEARATVETNLRTPEGKAYDQQLETEFVQNHLAAGAPVQTERGKRPGELSGDQARHLLSLGAAEGQISAAAEGGILGQYLPETGRLTL
jgi:hypothetical protein